MYVLRLPPSFITCSCFQLNMYSFCTNSWSRGLGGQLVNEACTYGPQLDSSPGLESAHCRAYPSVSLSVRLPKGYDFLRLFRFPLPSKNWPPRYNWKNHDLDVNRHNPTLLVWIPSKFSDYQVNTQWLGHVYLYLIFLWCFELYIWFSSK